MSSDKARGPGYEAIWLRQPDEVYRLVSDFKAGKPVHWPLLRPQEVRRLWDDFVKTGRVRDERALERVYESIRDNVVRLQIANIVSGHESMDPAVFLEDYLEADQHEAFSDWLIDSDDGWRISDYGIGPLTDAVALAYEARTSAAKLKYLDRALHVTHMRGDLSKLFIEGGRGTVSALESLEEPVPA